MHGKRSYCATLNSSMENTNKKKNKLAGRGKIVILIQICIDCTNKVDVVLRSCWETSELWPFPSLFTTLSSNFPYKLSWFFCMSAIFSTCFVERIKMEKKRWQIKFLLTFNHILLIYSMEMKVSDFFSFCLFAL